MTVRCFAKQELHETCLAGAIPRVQMCRCTCRGDEFADDARMLSNSHQKPKSNPKPRWRPLDSGRCQAHWLPIRPPHSVTIPTVIGGPMDAMAGWLLCLPARTLRPPRFTVVDGNPSSGPQHAPRRENQWMAVSYFPKADQWSAYPDARNSKSGSIKLYVETDHPRARSG
ncbi:hypothetical protein BGW36DRAFT_15340 [Talaromyces proteolyticus]|uniref:Uncharacterized protein n=1 Tax=Talaromyces proteolyticus TaxID=1131652 RepID=A0AAD4Q6Q4_9EURO|nr:uncharacterized protein BGW36DRAFT_15340 [Talaromyces proteolyticus]KAH8705567.1 hypothetical protein BGW36DRAFT_15340 [Talaromyces proteolyticus]